MIYIAHTDEQLKTELAKAQADLSSVLIKWTAGDTSVEKDKQGLERRVSQLVEEIRRRPSLSADDGGIIRRKPITRTRAVFS